MKIAIIDKKDIEIKLQNNAIKFDNKNIPIKLIDFLIINHKTILHSSDILQLNKSNISILIISYNNDNFSLIQSKNAKNSHYKLFQYQTLSNKLNIAKNIIRQKIISHINHLSKYGMILDESHYTQKILLADTIDELLGIEGSFSREYFKNYFMLLPKTLHKSKRTKRPPLDPVNALLSYWYSLYYFIITARLLSFGLEPYISYLHTPFREHYSLSSDLLEFFRANINEAVLQIFKNNILQKSDFTYKKGVYLKYEGRKKIWKYFVSLINMLKPKLDNSISTLKKQIGLNNDEIYSYS
jgi:CRISPR-associated protein Cas1